MLLIKLNLYKIYIKTNSALNIYEYGTFRNFKDILL